MTWLRYVVRVYVPPFPESMRVSVKLMPREDGAGAR